LDREAPIADPARAKLRAAIERHAEERDRLDQLEQAQSKCHAQLADLNGQVGEAEAAVERAEQNRPQALAEAFINNLPLNAGCVTMAGSVLDQVRTDQQRYREVEAALAREIEASQTRLRMLRAPLYSAIAEVLTGSLEFAALCAANERAWADLRAVRRAFYRIDRSLAGYFPDPWQSRYQAQLPLDPANDYPAYPVEQALGQAWAEALDRLFADADAKLPEG
jgi:hypothetical protein